MTRIIWSLLLKQKTLVENQISSIVQKYITKHSNDSFTNSDTGIIFISWDKWKNQ